MGSNLQQAIAVQESKTSSKNRGFTDWKQIKSPTVRDQVYLANKEAILENERLKKKVEEKQEELKEMGDLSLDGYEIEYEKLDSDIKEFFASPTEIRKKQEIERNENKVLVENEVKKAEQKKSEKKEYYDAKIKREEERWSENKGRYAKRGNEYYDKQKERYKERVNDYEDDWDEKEAYYNGYINKLNWGMGQLSSGKNFSFNEIRNFASDYGDYRERREEARNDNRKLRKKFDSEIKEVQNAKNWNMPRNMRSFLTEFKICLQLLILEK